MPGSAEQIIRAAVQAMLDSALALHRAGQFEPAAKLYGQILKIDSNHADSLHLLGMVANQARMTDLAIELIEKAISINHRVAAYHSNLGTILQAQQRLTEAAAHYAVALILDPQMAETHLNLGLVLQTQGRL